MKLPEGLVEIGESSMPPTLKKVSFPSTLRKIKRYAFAYTKITDIQLNEGLLEIESEAFLETKLNKVRLPKSLKKIGNYDNNYHLIPTPEELEEIGLKDYNPKKYNDFHIFHDSPLKRVEVYEDSFAFEYAKFYRMPYRVIKE